jgi:hypothetical protein
VRRRQRRWTKAALVRRDHREKERGRAGGGEQGGDARGLGLALEASNQID